MPLFLVAMRSISASDCGCLPDCQFTDFFYSVSTNKFMECDSRNLNIDPLCTLGGGPLPKLWLNGVTKKYEESYDSLPSYISNLASPMRKRHQDELIGAKDGQTGSNQYNAWEEDIA